MRNHDYEGVVFFINSINADFQDANPIPEARVNQYHIYHVVFYAVIMGVIAIIKLESTAAILAIVAKSACLTKAMFAIRFSLLAILESSLTRRAKAPPVGNFSNGIAAFGDLTDSDLLKFRGKSWWGPDHYPSQGVL